MWAKICLFLIIFVGVTANLVDGALVEIYQPDGNTESRVGQYSSHILGHGQSFRVDEPGLISEIQIYFSRGLHRNFSTTEIICELRDSEGTILQNSSISGFYYYDKGWKSFPFNKNVSIGYYILTLYINNISENYYYIGVNSKNPYLEGTCYYFEDFDGLDTFLNDWDSWREINRDLMFKVVIQTEGDSIKAPANPKGSPPDTPSHPAGPSSSFTGIKCLFITTTTDPDNDQIKYTFDWGDGTISTTEFVNSSFSVSNLHSWTYHGNYSVKVFATDSRGLNSAWSSPLLITIKTIEKKASDEELEKILVQIIINSIFKMIKIILIAIGLAIGFFYFLKFLFHRLSKRLPNADLEILGIPLSMAVFIGYIVSEVLAAYPIGYNRHLIGIASSIITGFIFLAMKYRAHKQSESSVTRKQDP